MHIVRYEDLCLKMNETVDALLDFLDLPWHKLVQKFISDNTVKDDDKKPNSNAEVDYSDIRTLSGEPYIYSTRRNSTNMAFEWREHIDNEDISQVQTFCKTAMNMLGYNLMKNISNNRFDDKYALLVDPLLKFIT